MKEPIPIRDVAGHLVCNIIPSNDEVVIEFMRKKVVTQIKVRPDLHTSYFTFQTPDEDGKLLEYTPVPLA